MSLSRNGGDIGAGESGYLEGSGGSNWSADRAGRPRVTGALGLWMSTKETVIAGLLAIATVSGSVTYS